MWRHLVNKYEVKKKNFNALELFKRQKGVVPLLGCTLDSPSPKIKYNQLQNQENQYDKQEEEKY